MSETQGLDPKNMEKALADTRAEITKLYDLFDVLSSFSAKFSELSKITEFKEAVSVIAELASSILEPVCFKFLYVDPASKKLKKILGEDLPDKEWQEFWSEDETVQWALERKDVFILPMDENLKGTQARAVIHLPFFWEPGEKAILLIWVKAEEKQISKIHMDLYRTLSRQASTRLGNQSLLSRVKTIRDTFDNILENVPLGIIALGKDDRIIACNSNAEFMFRLKRITLLDEKYQEVLPPQVSHVFTSILVSILSGDDVFDYEFEYQLDDSKTITLGISASVMYSGHGEPSGTVFICRDLSLSREVQKLREIDTMKSEFLHTVSHELKTPLTAIMGGTEILLMDPDLLNEEQLELVNIVDDASKKLFHLITELLDLSKLESGNLGLDTSVVDLRDIITSVTNLYHNRENVAIDYDYDANVPKIYLDRNKIEKVVMNYVSNAVKYSPGGATVLVSLKKEGDFLKLAVRDHGLGIPEDQLPFVWDKFYRVDSSTTAEIEGTGLGLPIAKHIIEMHDGIVGVDSKQGEGSTFWFTLPLRTDQSDSPLKEDNN